MQHGLVAEHLTLEVSFYLINSVAESILAQAVNPDSPAFNPLQDLPYSAPDDRHGDHHDDLTDNFDPSLDQDEREAW
jgi:hypothetical protein